MRLGRPNSSDVAVFILALVVGAVVVLALWWPSKPKAEFVPRPCVEARS